ncbi:hypothetical protein HDU93_001013 [Gonapodya sp. JEL0774]|nr:hypothetical protein HDU93_001013 [Gonapodya sp. JEL0774]
MASASEGREVPVDTETDPLPNKEDYLPSEFSREPSVRKVKKITSSVLPIFARPTLQEWGKFDWKDPFNTESLLTEEEKMVRDSVREYAQSRLAPGVVQASRDYRESPSPYTFASDAIFLRPVNQTMLVSLMMILIDFDRNIYYEMGDLGILGANVKGYGAAGVSSVAYGLIAREVEKVDSSYRSALSVPALVMNAIYQYGPEHLRKKYIPPIAKGVHVAAFGLTEPDHSIVDIK